MADATFDAVIIGGGTKTLVTAMYLAKYGGMSVGIFERRTELGGGLGSSEAAAGGFISDHAGNLSAEYYLPIQADFPDFAEKGGKFVQYLASAGAIMVEDHSCGMVYSFSGDPTQERTATSLAKFASERDAEVYMKLWAACGVGSRLHQALIEEMYSLKPPPGEATLSERWLADYLAQPDCVIDHRWLQLPVYQAIRELWESLPLQYLWLRRGEEAECYPDQPGAARLLRMISSLPGISFAVGGSHSVAHAYQRILLENGAKWFSRCEVERVLIQNGYAKGVRLTDGTEVAARKIVVSGVDPYQLCFRLIGSEHLSDKILTKVRNLQRSLMSVAWFTWALHEPLAFKAENFNPDISKCRNIVFGSRDGEAVIRAGALRRAGINPPVDGQLYYYQYANLDETRTPQGKHAGATSQLVLPANALDEHQWMQFKRKHAEDVIRELQKYAPNMTWDNVIGYEPHTPWDTANRFSNMAPEGNVVIVDGTPGQTGRFRPILELAQHRTPVKNLYATGGGWGGGGSSATGYTCYKAIAADLGLGKPWEQQGRPY